MQKLEDIDLPRLRVPLLQLFRNPWVLGTSQFREVCAASLGIRKRVTMVEEIFESSHKFLVEVLNARVLVDVQIEKVTEGVVIWLELVDLEALIQSLQHLLRVQARWWEWWADFENLEHDFFCERQENVEFDFAIVLDPFSALF